MKVYMSILWLVLLACGDVNTPVSIAASRSPMVPLCDLQRTTKQGEHRLIQVKGVYTHGFEGSVLTDSACPAESTWVEFTPQSPADKGRLDSIVDAEGSVLVVFEGLFYGPGLPDPNLPEAIRKSFQPGYGHLGAFRTQLIVFTIKSVKPAPIDH